MLYNGTYFIMNKPVEESDKFIKKELYGYVFKKPKTKFLIEVEYYLHNILVISFYRDGYGIDNGKYRLRFDNTSPIITLNVFKACLSIYQKISKKGNYALFYHASDDIGTYKEYNDRFSAYDRFFEYYLDDYRAYTQIGSLALNIKGYYHSQLYMTPNIIEAFFRGYAESIQAMLNEGD